MPDSVTSLITGVIGGAIGAAIQYGLRRYDESDKIRREIIETHLPQLQNSAESLYYRTRNLLDWAGKTVMPDEYFMQTSAYTFGRLLAHEALLVSKGDQAKIQRNAELKRNVKSRFHSLNWAMDDQAFFHYRRVQLGEMLLDGDRVITYTEFRTRWTDPAFSEVVAAVSLFVQTMDTASETEVPSALELGKERP